ncbi:hypothetical protein [Nonomuraea sp. NPDC050202]|uniref:hypothetical protein n=1 Tax=Nonomuraea sp. NPDC050202 TaxID=3155035 RepID=UPI0033CE780A
MALLRNLRIVLGIDLNESGLKKADRALRDIDKRLGSVGRKAAMGAGLTALAGSATALTAALLPAAGAVAAMPGALAAGQAAAATFKVGVLGMGEAMTAVAEGDAAALEESLAKLSPSARAFVKSAAGLKGAFDPIQRAVQQRMFAGLDREMTPVANNLLPEIKTGMLGVASGFNLGAREALAFGKTPMARGAANKVFASSSRIMTQLGGAVRPALAGVTSLTVASLPLAERMASWAVNGVKAASAFLTSERGAAMLDRTVDRAGDTLAQLGRIGLNIGRVVVSAFGQMDSSGDGVLDTVERLTAQAAKWAGSVEGQRKMAEMFALLRDVAADVGAVLPLVAGPLGLVADLLTSLPGPIRDVVTQGLALALIIGPLAGKLGGVASAGLHVASGVQRMRESVAAAGGPMAVLGTAATKTRTALGAAAGLLTGPWGLALAAGATALGFFATRNNQAEAQVEELTRALQENKGVLDERAIATVKDALQTSGAYKAAERLGIAVRDVTDAALGYAPAQERVNAVVQRNILDTNTAGDAAMAMSVISDENSNAARKLRDALSGQNEVLGDSRERYRQMTAASGGVVESSARVASGMDGVGRSADKASAEVGELNVRLGRFRSLTADADTAALDFRDKIDDLTGSFKRNGAALDSRTGKFNVNTKAGRDNQRAVIDLIRAAVDHADKLVKEGRSADTANRALQRHIDKLRSVLRQSGLSRAEIDRLIRRYVTMPGEINAATGRIKNKTVTIRVNADGTVSLPGGVKASLWATGGVLPGFTPGRDVHTFVSPTGGVLGLSGGEAVMRPEWTRAVGSRTVEEMNAAARRGGVPAVKRMLAGGVGPQRMGGEGAFFADGGIISKHSFHDFGKIPGAMARYNRKVGEVAWAAAQKITKKLNEVSLGGPGVQKAAKWARAQAGKPYIWGGVGPRGYDCSGAWSALTNVIQGRYPHRRLFTTHSFGSRSGPGGYVRNRKSAVRVGVTDAGVGHMAGTIGRLNFESRGSRGVVIGGAARGADNGLFSRRYGLAKFDNGGVWEPGTFGFNGLREPEYVFTKQQMQQGSRLAEVHIHATINVPTSYHKGAVARELHELLTDYQRGSGARFPK